VTAPLSGKRLLLVAEDAELSALVASAASRAGAELELAAGGVAALETLAANPPSAAVLDLPLADLGAPELLAACARAGVPAIVVSGVHRGPQAAAEARRLGARELFEKPFEIDALLAAVARLVGAAPPPLDDEAPDDVSAALPLRPDEEPISAALPPALDAPPAGIAPLPRDGFATPLPETRRGRPVTPDAPPPPEGDLARTSVPRLLVALHVGQATGALTITRGAVKKIVVVERGVPVYAASNVGAERFGAICVRRGVVGQERLEAVRRDAPDARTGDALVAAGVLRPEARVDLLAGQIRAIAWSTFEWRDGSYAFQLGRPPAARVPVRLAMGDLVLDGVRRTATLPRLRADVPDDAHLAPAPDPAFELYALAIRPAEAHLLALADGTKSAADLVRLADLGARDALAFLHACRVLRVLDEVDRVLASTRRIGFM
jgi:CheY-like chemotaxis protein